MLRRASLLATVESNKQITYEGEGEVSLEQVPPIEGLDYPIEGLKNLAIGDTVELPFKQIDKVLWKSENSETIVFLRTVKGAAERPGAPLPGPLFPEENCYICICTEGKNPPCECTPTPCEDYRPI